MIMITPARKTTYLAGEVMSFKVRSSLKVSLAQMKNEERKEEVLIANGLNVLVHRNQVKWTGILSLNFPMSKLS